MNYSYFCKWTKMVKRTARCRALLIPHRGVKGLIKFFKGALKFTENFQEVMSNELHQFRSPAIQFCWNSLASATFICQR